MASERDPVREAAEALLMAWDRHHRLGTFIDVLRAALADAAPVSPPAPRGEAVRSDSLRYTASCDPMTGRVLDIVSINPDADDVEIAGLCEITALRASTILHDLARRGLVEGRETP